MGSHVDSSLKESMSSGEDGPWNQGQVLQRCTQEEPLEQGWIRTVVDNNRVAMLDEKYASCCKIPRNIVEKGIIEEILWIGESGRGEYMEDQGSTGRRGDPFPPNLKCRLSRIHGGGG